jgi:hypothetical protein
MHRLLSPGRCAGAAALVLWAASAAAEVTRIEVDTLTLIDSGYLRSADLSRIVQDAAEHWNYAAGDVR